MFLLFSVLIVGLQGSSSNDSNCKGNNTQSTEATIISTTSYQLANSTESSKGAASDAADRNDHLSPHPSFFVPIAKLSNNKQIYELETVSS